jgi:hypothetical protein
MTFEDGLLYPEDYVGNFLIKSFAFASSAG